jgi:hypothetical protein
VGALYRSLTFYFFLCFLFFGVGAGTVFFFLAWGRGRWEPRTVFFFLRGNRGRDQPCFTFIGGGGGERTSVTYIFFLTSEFFFNQNWGGGGGRPWPQPVPPSSISDRHVSGLTSYSAQIRLMIHQLYQPRITRPL